MFVYADIFKTIVPRKLAFSLSNLVNFSHMIMSDFSFIRIGIMDFKIKFCNSFYSLWQASMRLEGILQHNFSKMFINFPSKASASISLGITIIPRHFRLDHWALAHHWRSIFTSLRDKRELICFVTESSDFNLEKLSFTLWIFPNTLLLAWSSLFWKYKTMVSCLDMLCIDYALSRLPFSIKWLRI